MKPRLFILATVLTVACSEWTAPTPRQITLVLDKSDKHLLQTVGEDLPELLKSIRPVDPWGAVDLRIVLLTSVAYNRSTEFELPAEDPDEGNILVRKKKVEAFLERAADVIRLVISEPRSDSASVVCLPVTLELERLSACNTCECEVIIYSDLIEHLGKDKWSLYDDRLLDSLRRTPEAFDRYFEKQRPIPDLTGITISVVTIPKNTPNSARVAAVFAWNERRWKAKHATVTISGNYHSGK